MEIVDHVMIPAGKWRNVPPRLAPRPVPRWEVSLHLLPFASPPRPCPTSRVPHAGRSVGYSGYSRGSSPLWRQQQVRCSVGQRSASSRRP